jgi:hypothetical protein
MTATSEPLEKFYVREIVLYLVEAVDEDEAIQMIIDAPDRDKWCVEVEDRDAWSAEETK